MVICAGYYVKSSGGASLLGDAYSSDATLAFNPPTYDTVPGVYFCDNHTGCNKHSTLVLGDDQNVEFIVGKDDQEVPNVQNQDQMQLESDQSAHVLPTVTSNIDDKSSVVHSISTDDTHELTDGINASSTLSPEAHQLREALLSQATLPREQGTWVLGNGGILIITIIGTEAVTYDVPKKIIVGRVSTTTLERLSFNKSLYPFLKKPIFIKQAQ